MGRFTDVQIRHWLKAMEPVAKADGGGLTFTLSPKGTAAWVLRYRFAGKPRELTLGRYPDISLTKARKLATENRALIQQGRNVARERQSAKTISATATSFAGLAKDYMDKAFPHLAANTVKQRRQHIEGVILPKLGRLAAKEITAEHVVRLIEPIGKRSQNVAELVFTALSQIFNHGVARHVLTANPCAVVSVSAVVGKPIPKRARLKLTEQELRTLLPELPSIGPQNALATKILLATCVRTGELAHAEWGHLDFDRAEWFIPDANSKTRRDLIVPLVPAVIEWFNALKPFAAGSRYVLPARHIGRQRRLGGDVPYDHRALNAMLHKLHARLGGNVRRFTPHDLRSTARSHLAALGVDVIVAERCLNHSLGGLVAIYDRHDYARERRAALQLWTSFILACEKALPWIPEASNVIPLMIKTA
jgi:integrase